MKIKLLIVPCILLLTVFATVGCMVTTEPAAIANPASEYCVEQGGIVDIREDGDGGQVGYCLFDDGSECEEWSFFRGNCAPGDFPSSTNIANPASEYCIEQGGMVVVQQRDDGGEYGVCTFEDNRQCEEWALLRGACPVGGVKITGYITQAAQYCAITGGSYVVTDSSADEEQGTCTLPDGQTCDVWAYFRGECTVGSG